MIQPDTKLNFFRQSGWMMASNVGCGVFMAAAAFTAANVTPGTDYSVFVTILRVFVIVTLPAAGIQTILAQQSAAAVSEEANRDVAATVRGVFKLTAVFWIFLALAAAIYSGPILAALQASNATVLWAALALILAAYWFPGLLGILQGRQQFLPFGWAMILNGVGRFGAILLGVKFFQISATGATLGAFAGFVFGVLAAFWPARHALRHEGGHFDWRGFLKKLVPLTAGAGSTLFIINVDMPLIQSRFDKDYSNLYAAAETIGIAVVTLCVPVAAVMFPKLVRSRATATKSDALSLAVIGTAVIGGSAALCCTLFPELPLRILFFKNPEMLRAAPLIPWFMWAMVPVTLYNVLVNNLIARDRYAILPFSAMIPIAYAIVLNLFLQNTELEPLDAFRRVIQILTGFSTALLLAAVYFSFRASRADAAGARSPATAPKP